MIADRYCVRTNGEFGADSYAAPLRWHEQEGIHAMSAQSESFRLSLVLAVAGVLTLPGSAVASEDDPLAFPLQQARRDQQRETTAAAAYRAALDWPVGDSAGADAAKWWLSGSAGIEFDSDVVLFTNAIGPPDEIDERDHAGGVWFVEGGAELFDSGRFSGGLLGSYWGTAYSDLNGFDTNFPTIGSWVDLATTDATELRLRYDFGYAWVDGDGYAESHHVKPSFFIDWDTAGDSEISVEYYYYDFDKTEPNVPIADGTGAPGMCSTPPSTLPCGPDSRADGARKDRTGWGFTFGGEHRKELAFNNTQVRGGYFYEHYIPDGAEFHNQSHQLWIGARTSLPLGFTLDGETSLMYQSTRNKSAYPDPDQLAPNVQYGLQDIRRHDVVWKISTLLGRQIAPGVSASLEYAYTHRGSNYEVFDYNLHRLGAYLTVQLH